MLAGNFLKNGLVALSLATVCTRTDGAVVEGLEVFGELELVDEISCADDSAHRQVDFPVGASYATNILGSACRVLHHVEKNASGKESGALLRYRIGEGRGLEANAAYVLAVEYPEDAPRAMTVVNNGNGSRRGFHTGATVGDALTPKYVSNFCEALDIPLSGAWEQWAMPMFLNEKTNPYNVESATLLPAEGFDVVLALFPQADDPLSHGVAVRAIKLYKVVDEAAAAAPVAMPDGLPRRHLFWREEMSDGVVDNNVFADPLSWYDHKARMMRLLGMNTFSKDLLEFGANQHWDSTYNNYGGNNWVYLGSKSDLWGRIVELMGDYGHAVFPYYEYSGSRGYSGLGPQKRAWTLYHDNGRTAYTQTSWIEASLVDLTSAAAHEDFKKMLDCTVLRYKDKAEFVGAWIRSRLQMPVSFHDDTIALFNTENSASATRAQLVASYEGDKVLYNAYHAWWYLKRKEFFAAMRDFMRENGVDGAQMLYSSTMAESGEYMSNWYDPLVADAGGAEQFRAAGYTDTISGQGSMSWYYYEYGLKGPWPNWGNYEYQHAGPADDPENYAAEEGVGLAYPFNRTFTVVNRDYLDAYRNAGGLALIRHYSLNENMLFDTADARIAGYFTADFERAGRACMQSEVMAMAQGDPTMIGYLVGANFGRGFAAPAREFNLNFLALPALPSEIVFSENNIIYDAVTLRRITTGSHGTFFALTHVGHTPKPGARVVFPAGTAAVYECVGGRKHVPDANGVMTLDLNSFQLLSFTTLPPTQPRLAVRAENVAVDSADVVTDVISIGTASGTLVVDVALSEDFNAPQHTFTTQLADVAMVTNRLVNLIDSTRYHVRATLTNSGGDVAVARTSFMTPVTDAVPSFTVSARVESCTHATVTLDVASFGTGAVAGGTTVRFATTPLLENAGVVTQPLDAVGIADITLDRLDYRTTYYVGVTVANTAGRSFTADPVVFTTPDVEKVDVAGRGWTPGLTQIKYGCEKNVYPDLDVEVYGHDTEQVVPGTIMADTQTSAVNTFNNETSTWQNNTTFAYAGEMWMAGGTTYNFAGIIDDGEVMHINGTKLFESKSWAAYGKGSFTPPSNGWYGVDIRFFDWDGGKGPSENAANKWGADMGFAWNTNGLATPTSATGWQRLRDATGRLLRTRTRLPQFVFIDQQPYRDGDDVIVPLRTESVVNGARLQAYLGPSASFAPEDWVRALDLGAVSSGTVFTQVQFIGAATTDDLFVVARLTFADGSHDTWTEPVLVGDTPPPPLVFGATSVDTADNGTSAQICVEVTRVNIEGSDIEIYINGRGTPDAVLTGITAPGVYYIDVDGFAPNKDYTYAATSGGAAAQGGFTTRHTVANPWLTVDFEGYTIGPQWRDTLDATGEWTVDAESNAEVTAEKYLRLSTSENAFARFTAVTPSTDGNNVIVDMRCQIFGAETLPAEPPATGADSPLQTAIVFATTRDGVATMHAWVDAGGGNAWRRLTSPGLTLLDESWLDITAELDYLFGVLPRVRFFVDGFAMVDDDGADWQTIANAGVAPRRLAALEFANAGTVDFFTGELIEYPGLYDVLFTFGIFLDGILEPSALALLDPWATRTTSVPSGADCEITLPAAATVSGHTVALDGVAVMTNATDFALCPFGENAPHFTAADDGLYRFAYPTAGLAIRSEPYAVNVFYTITGTVPGIPAPVIGPGAGGKALTFATIDDVDYFVVNITNPQPGVWYTAFASETLNGQFTSAAASTQAAPDAVEMLFHVPTAGARSLFVIIHASTAPVAAGIPLPPSGPDRP